MEDKGPKYYSYDPKDNTKKSIVSQEAFINQLQEDVARYTGEYSEDEIEAAMALMLFRYKVTEESTQSEHTQESESEAHGSQEEKLSKSKFKEITKRREKRIERLQLLEELNDELLKAFTN